VVVFSETYKFTDKVSLDPINNNEIGDPQKILNNLHNKKGIDFAKSSSLTLLNLKYDLTRCENINMVRFNSVIE
jgi:translation initiation factor 2B subunit (eIF-2B alpha/beta/delta family)